MIATATEPSAGPADDVLLERMVFGWWNTSLSPGGKHRADDRHKKIAGNIVRSLINDLHVDCLALGEITETDLELLRGYAGKASFSSYDGTHKLGPLKFDTGLLYDATRLEILHDESFVREHLGRRLKVANRIDFRSFSSGSRIHVFLSHWPARGGLGGQEQNIHFRKKSADCLLEQVKQIDALSPNPAIILLGDFNDEPFNESLSFHLTATRDRHLTRTKKAWLYNPFWRHLGESAPHSILKTNKNAVGSHFYRKGAETRWHTFDQMLFSASFLGGGPWHLNEQYTMILQSEFLIDLMLDNGSTFDHLPILSVIERKININ